MESIQITCVLWCLHIKSDLSESLEISYIPTTVGKVTVVNINLAKFQNEVNNLDIKMSCF